MSRIKDLEIRGVRNFGDESGRARIRFSKPLTLILGPNGTGKTTIIEALKFITSGEYPPDSDKGKSFVHEPKLTLNHSVKGQIKVKVCDKSGQDITLTRTMQVTRLKTGALKFQALDNTLTRIDKNTRESKQTTNRCIDVDKEMLNAMGVSKPILNYVIFCHQEESNWPLEGGKNLKDRFDEIFDTSKYNKAMDITTKLIKDLQTELNEIKAYEKGLKDMVDEVESQEEKLRDNERREQESRNRIKGIEESIKPIDDRANEIMHTIEEYSKLERELKKIENSYELTKSHINTLKKHIKHIHNGTKEELMQRIDTYDTNLSQKVLKKKENEDELKSIENRETYLTKKLADTRIQLGSLTQKKLAFDEKVSRRNELLTKVLELWKISANDSSFTEDEVKDYINQIDNKFKGFSSSMKSRIYENEQEEKHVQNEVDTSRNEKTEIYSEMSLKDKEKKEIEIEINDLRKKIKEAGEAGDRLSSIESELNSATKNYDTIVQSFDEETFKENLQTEISMKKQLNVKITNIDQEINSLHQQSSQQAELELHQNSLQEKEQSISSLISKHKSNFELLFDGKETPQTKLKESLEKIQRSLTNEKNNLTIQIDDEQKKKTTLQTTLKFRQNELVKVSSELEGYKEKVKSECQDNDYEEILRFQERKVKSLQDQRGILANQSLMYEEYLKKLKKKSCCPLCDRGFQNASEEKTLQQKLHAEIKSSPQALKDCEKELKVEQARYDALQQLKPVTEQILDIETVKLPKMNSVITKFKEDLQKSEENLENMRLILSEPEEKLNICKSVVGDVILLDNYINEKDNLNKIIEAKKRQMFKAGKIGDRSMQEAQNEREALKKRFANIEKNIEQIQSDLQAGLEKVQKAREHKNKLNEEVIHIRQSMQSLNQLRAKVNELYDKVKILESSLRSLRQKLVVAEEQLATKEDELNILKQKHREEQEKDINFKSKCTTELHELRSVQQEVLKFINSKIDENLKKVEVDEEKIKIDCEKKKVERLELEERIRFLDEQCRSQESGKRDLEHNVELLTKKEELTELKEQMAQHQESLTNLQSEKLKREYKNLQDKKEKLEREKNEIKGAQGELENVIKTLKRSLNQEKYRMARHNYKEKKLQLYVQEETIANLKEYVTILDQSMIQYHEERMSTVNKIMAKLWTLVYSGNDTSSIQIRVDKTEGIGDKRRSYNYKLVQIKRSTEMDMKGKCSAGQKVLASIIIRMALAETFCSDCAVLALDEPTTNLDEENATNLALTLSKVIQLRAQHHKNFQLIVITHDEKFISHLSNLSGKQIFQELYRNAEGYSEVRRRDMSEYLKNSQDEDSKYDDESDEEEEEEAERVAASRKRQLSGDDSPPRQGTSKRRAY